MTSDAGHGRDLPPCSRRSGATLDFLVHAIGFSNKDELEGRYIDTSAENFALTMNISVYSFTAVAKRAEALMNARRLAADADLLRRREVRAELQRHGRRQGGARGLGALSRASISARRASASTPSRPAPSRRSPPPASPGLRDMLHWQEGQFAAAPQRHHRRRRLGRALPALRPRLGRHRRRSTTSMAASTSSA